VDADYALLCDAVKLIDIVRRASDYWTYYLAFI